MASRRYLLLETAPCHAQILLVLETYMIITGNSLYVQECRAAKNGKVDVQGNGDCSRHRRPEEVQGLDSLVHSNVMCF